MATRRIYATKKQKALVLVSSMAAVIVCICAFWLWRIEKLPLYVGIAFALIAIALIGRVIAINRFPAVVLDGSRLVISGWFGGAQIFDLSAPIESAHRAGAIFLKQGQSGAGIARYVIGSHQFDEIADAIRQSQDVRR